MHILILGGTTEASALAGLLAKRSDIKTTLSLAGRTRAPGLPPGTQHRIGGFGGADGLADWLREHAVTALIDATHPFASIMPFNAAQAAAKTGVPILSLLRPEWVPQAGDLWTEVASHQAAIALLGEKTRRVFLTVGRLEVDVYAAAPQHFYVVRSIDIIEPKPFMNAIFINGRGPFASENECALMLEHRIDIVVTKNSGGSATVAKIEAARALNIPVIAIRRPEKPDVPRVTNAHDALNWIHNLAS